MSSSGHKCGSALITRIALSHLLLTVRRPVNPTRKLVPSKKLYALLALINQRCRSLPLSVLDYCYTGLDRGRTEETPRARNKGSHRRVCRLPIRIGLCPLTLLCRAHLCAQETLSRIVGKVRPGPFYPDLVQTLTLL